MHPYLPHTQGDIKAMLERCHVGSLDELYSDVPDSLRLKRPYSLPKAMSEPELGRYFKTQIGDANEPLRCFAGAGWYHHYCPAAVQSLLSRSEFLTAYTPYQPEISQGTLQYIFEYQSMMCELTGMDVSNASMYDGATATAEAVVMAVNASKKRRRVLVSATLAPAVAQVIATYAAGAHITVEVIAEDRGVTSRTELEEMICAGDVAAVVVASPNYYGILEDYSGFAELCHQSKALFIVNSHATTLSVLRTPGEWGADIACGEAQSLGMPMNYGGPGLGYLCCKRALMRKLPGRIVGATTDAAGRRSFVLTLQAREQHIRRQKATSNICSNQGIMTLHAAIYMSLMGAKGLRRVNRISAEAAHALADKMLATGKVVMKYPGHVFLNEFAVETVSPLTADTLLKALDEKGILGGVKLTENSILVAATEMCTPDDIEMYVSTLNSL